MQYHKRNLFLGLFIFVFLLSFLSFPCFAKEDFIIKIGQTKQFTEFNYHTTNIEADPNNPLPKPRYLTIKSPEKKNFAEVFIEAPPNTAGVGVAEVGVNFQWDLGNQTLDEVKDYNVRITIIFDYTVVADYQLGFGSANAQISIFPWDKPYPYKLVGYEAGSPGSDTKFDEKVVYNFRVGDLEDLGRVIKLESYCQAHLIKDGAGTHRSYAKVTISSIEICFCQDDPQAFLERPIPLGVAGNNKNSPCGTGTLGCLLKDDNGIKYILTCAHVINANEQHNPVAGDPIVQPMCFGSQVAILSYWDYKGIGTPEDMAIAQIIPGEVDPFGNIMCIGQISAIPMEPKQWIKKRVMKMGAKTSLTTGVLSKAVGNLLYIKGEEGPFSSEGDSGALIVTDSDIPQPLGLLIGHTKKGPELSVAIPIQTVLNTKFDGWLDLGLSVVGMYSLGADTTQQTDAVTTEEYTRMKSILKTNADYLMQLEGVLDAGIDFGEDGKPAKFFIAVKEKTPLLERRLPKQLEGIEVEIFEIGEIID